MEQLNDIRHIIDILPPRTPDARQRLDGAEKLFRSRLNPRAHYRPSRYEYKAGIIYLATILAEEQLVGAALFGYTEHPSQTERIGNISYLVRKQGDHYRGLGSLLVSLCENTLQGYGCSQIHLTAAHTLEAMIFWESLQYTVRTEGPSADYCKRLD